MMLNARKHLDKSRIANLLDSDLFRGFLESRVIVII